MKVRILSEIASAKTGLDCEGVLNLELLPAHDPTRPLLSPLDDEGAVGVAEHLGLLFDQVWEDALTEFCVVFVAVAVHEYILFPRVAMQIDEKNDVPLVLHIFDEPL